jgi:hypothetical protein
MCLPPSIAALHLSQPKHPPMPVFLFDAGAGTGAGAGGAAIGATRTTSSSHISAVRSTSSTGDGLVHVAPAGPAHPPRAPTSDSVVVQLQALDVFSILETLRHLGLHLPFLRIKLAVGVVHDTQQLSIVSVVVSSDHHVW